MIAIFLILGLMNRISLRLSKLKLFSIPPIHFSTTQKFNLRAFFLLAHKVFFLNHPLYF
jgi:hypothetical protein